MASTVEIRDFTVTDENHKFRINDDVFEAYAVVPISVMAEMGKLRNVGENLADNGVEYILDIFDLFLTEPSAQRFRERVTNDRIHPIGMQQVTSILPWLMEQYGLRPTQPLSDSSTGSDSGETSTPSTAGQPVMELEIGSEDLPGALST